MAKYKLEYLWLDGYTPVPNLRGKTQIKEFAKFPTLAQLPMWGFDGSSTRQAEGHSSDCMLKPVAVFPDSTRKNGVPMGEPGRVPVLAPAHQGAEAAHVSTRSACRPRQARSLMATPSASSRSTCRAIDIWE